VIRKAEARLEQSWESSRRQLETAGVEEDGVERGIEVG